MSNELYYPWAFWFSPVLNRHNIIDATSEYENQLILLSEIHTVEEAMSIYVFLQKLSEMQFKEIISLFRIAKRPVWEENPAGGCFILKFSRKDVKNAENCWEKLVFECIRNAISEDIDGISASPKKHEISIQIWMREAAVVHKQIGEHLKKVLNLETLEVYLKYHKDSLKDLSSFKNSTLMTY